MVTGASLAASKHDNCDGETFRWSAGMARTLKALPATEDDDEGAIQDEDKDRTNRTVHSKITQATRSKVTR